MSRQFAADQVSRGRGLVAADRTARLELGELLLEVAPPADADAEPQPDADDPLAAFASAIGLSFAQARRYRTVALAVRRARSEAPAATPAGVSYAALTAGLTRPGGSAELLADVCRKAAAEGREQVTVDDVEAARRAAVRAEARLRREQQTSDRAERARREERVRDAALAAYRDGIEELVAARVVEGTRRAEAETAVVREAAERIADDGGNPSDLLKLGSSVIDRHAEIVKTVRRRATELRSAANRLGTAERTLRRLLDSDALESGSDVTAERWLATLDQIITHSVELAERLRERGSESQ